MRTVLSYWRLRAVAAFLGLAIELSPARLFCFDLGIYTSGRVESLKEIERAGFDLVVGPATKGFLDAAYARDLGVVGSVGLKRGPIEDPCALAHRADSLDRHPALVSWYLVDEPDFRRVSPMVVNNYATFFDRMDARKPKVLVLRSGRSTAAYQRFGDEIWVDDYPIPWSPLASFGKNLELARFAVGAEKTLFGVLQAFSWESFQDVLGLDTEFRVPTFDELRCMAYDALTKEVNGLMFYTFRARDWELLASPELWASVRALVQEIESRERLFDAAAVWWPYVLRVSPEGRRFNGALNPAVSTILKRVADGDANVPAGLYVVCVNTTPHALTVEIESPAVFKAPFLPVFGEERLAFIDSGVLSDVFEPYEVHVYGPIL